GAGARPTGAEAARLRGGRAAVWSAGVSDVGGVMFVLGGVVLFLAAAAQVALVYIDRARLRHMLEEGTPRASALMRLLDEPTSTLSTILVVYTVSLCAAAAAGFWLDLELWVNVAPWAGIVGALIALLVLLLAQFLGRVLA